MDIIKVNKYFQYKYRPPPKGIFNNKDIGKAEGEKQKAELSLKEQAKAHLAAAVAAEAAAQKEDAAADEETLAEEEEEAIKHNSEVKDEEREGGKIEGELPDIY